MLAPSLAQAHTGAEQVNSLFDGLMHPLTGLDHIAAMLAVGLWAAQRGNRALWMAPLSFMAVMLVGNMLASLQLFMPFVEHGINTSILVFGLLIATTSRLPVVATSLLVGLFAVFHGYAHGAEMPATATGLEYTAGFVLATGMLHACGICSGLLAQRLGHPNLIRHIGGATAALGLSLLLG